MTEGMDWREFERFLTGELIRAIRATISAYEGERFAAAALVHTYTEEGAVISLPSLALNTTGDLAQLPAGQREERWWYPADWFIFDDVWLSPGLARHWEKALAAEACKSTPGHWNATFRRYVTLLVRTCKRARSQLRAAADVDPELIIMALDITLGADEFAGLVKRVLTRRELSVHFPQLLARDAERDRVSALPADERAAYLISRLGTYDGLITSEDAVTALLSMGDLVIPGLLRALATRDRTWEIAKILADIGHSGEHVAGALCAALTWSRGPDQQWVARALSRLGHLDLVLARAGELPMDTVVTSVAAPYTSFRDYSAAPLPLDYRPLADFLERWPEMAHALTEQLGPGHECLITKGDVDAAIGGLASRHPVIRRHAASVLGDRALGSRARRRIVPALERAAREDPDAKVRMLAGISLGDWTQGHPS